MAASLRDHLLLCGLFDSVEVEATDDPDRYVAALCRIRPAHTEQDVAARLEALWRHRISHSFWEANAFVVEPGHVEFEAATRESVDGCYVTVHLVAQKAVIPAQRSPLATPVVSSLQAAAVASGAHEPHRTPAASN